MRIVTLALAAVFMFPARDAHAYLDPGTGSFIVQVLIASLLGALFTIKLWLGAVKRFIARLTSAGTKAKAAEDPDLADVPEATAQGDEETAAGS